MRKYRLLSVIALGLLFAETGWSHCNSWETLREIDNRAVSDAQAFIRAVSVSRNLDTDQDQYVSLEEIEDAQSRAEQNLDSRRKSLSTASRRFQGTRGEQITTSANDIRRLATADRRGCAALKEAGELQVVHLFVSRSSSGSFSLAGPIFHQEFGRLSQDARAALIEDDVNGNNDGLLSLEEYEQANRGGFFRRDQFRRRFGNDVHEYVLSVLSEREVEIDRQ